MLPDFEKLGLYEYFFPISSEWFDTDLETTLVNILSIRKFNLAIKYDYYWTDLEFNPESEDEVEEVIAYCKNYGDVLCEEVNRPFIWHFQKPEHVKRVAHVFFNADQMVFSLVSPPFNPSLLQEGSDDQIAAFWKTRTPYFLITIHDRCGYYFVSSEKKTVQSFENDLHKFMADRMRNRQGRIS